MEPKVNLTLLLKSDKSILYQSKIIDRMSKTIDLRHKLQYEILEPNHFTLVKLHHFILGSKKQHYHQNRAQLDFQSQTNQKSSIM